MRRLAIFAMTTAATAWVAVALADDSLHTLKFGDLTVSIPWSADWREGQRTAQDDPNGTQFGTEDELRLLVLLQAAPKWVNVQTQSAIESGMGALVKELSKTSVEKQLPLQKVTGPGAFGSYICATDRKPKPDEYKYICKGVLNVGGAPVGVTVLYNDAGKDGAKKALDSLKGLQLASGN